jgi:hypothetical protein
MSATTPAAEHLPKPRAQDAVRGLGVVYAGPLGIAGWWLTSFAALGKALLTGGSAGAPWVVGAGASLLYYTALRPRMLRWGASATEQTMPLPGDEVLRNPSLSRTRAISIAAPPDEVWPWLIQIGYRRGGWYSYDVLDAAAGAGDFVEGHSATHIHGELQDLTPGDRLLMSPWTGYEVEAVNPPASLILAIKPQPGEPYAAATWSFVLLPEARNGTRLLVRERSDYHGVGPAVRLIEHLTEAPHFIMERKMLLGIKERAERSQLITEPPHIDSILPDTEFSDTISVTVNASPDAILGAAMQVTANDMPVAKFLGILRYLPGRLLGRKPATDDAAPFLQTLLSNGTVILDEEPGREIVFGSAGKYHQLTDQEPQPFKTADDYHAFHDPPYQQLVMSLRVEPTSAPLLNRLVLEHRTHPLSEESRRNFRRYWRVIKPSGAFVTKQLLRAIKRRAEQVTST